MPTSTSFKFVFSSVRIPGSEIQLQEVRLYANGNRLSGMRATNPNGSSPDAQPPSDAVDNDLGFLDSCEPTCCTYATAPCTAHNNLHISDCGCTTKGNGPVCTCSHGSKWLDENMGQPGYSSTLVLSFAGPQTVTAYELITADDNDKRDPTAWTFYAKLDDTWVPYKAEQVESPPQLRYTSYGVSSISASPLPEGSHAEPLGPRPISIARPPPASAFELEGFQTSGPSPAVSPLAVALASSLSTAIVVILAVYCYWTRRVRPMIRMFNPTEIEQMQPMRADATTGNDGGTEFAAAADEVGVCSCRQPMCSSATCRHRAT